MNFDFSAAAGLWLAVVASGLYHGLNPGMGWPLAVSAGLMGDGRRDLLLSLIPLSVGHFLAMLVILLPFGLLISLAQWETELRIGASVIVIAAGAYLFFNRRHPRVLARIPPHRLALWSFAIATAHGAGLMLVPIYLGICGTDDAGHAAAASLMAANTGAALLVSITHTATMIVSGGVMAYLVHQWLGLKFLSRSWFNLDALWAISLVVVGAIGLTMALQGGGA